MRLRIRLKSLWLLLVGAFIYFLYDYFDVGSSPTRMRASKEGPVARITGEDLRSMQSFSGDVKKLLDHEHRVCSKECQAARAAASRRRYGYANRVSVENVTLPTEWSPSSGLATRLKERKMHVEKVCQKYNLSAPLETSQPNAWEFLYNQEYGLLWCNVFKAASSTWFYNFNLLSGYTEEELLTSKQTPISLARKKYPRLSVEQLVKAVNSSPKPLTFMIARHPLQRLVSAFRDKLLSKNRYFSKLAKTILQLYPLLQNTQRGHVPPQPQDQSQRSGISSARKSLSNHQLVPNFPQFVQFLIDSAAKGEHLDEHWAPMYKFCSPCLVDFDVFAKVETLDEDGNYIIFTAGVQNVIKPKRINRAKNVPTNVVADSYLCQLSRKQMEKLIQLYQYDLEIFDYSYEKYINCTLSNV